MGFDWPHDTVFVQYGNMHTFMNIVLELHTYGFHFVVQPTTQTIAMAGSAAVALGLEEEKDE